MNVILYFNSLIGQQLLIRFSFYAEKANDNR